MTFERKQRAVLDDGRGGLVAGGLDAKDEPGLLCHRSSPVVGDKKCVAITRATVKICRASSF